MGYRFALIGCGRISSKHAHAIQQNPDATLVAVCDIKPDRAKAAAKTYSVPAYTSYHKMIKAHPELDFLNILAESGRHAEICRDIAPYKKDIIVEKPLALTPEDAQSMLRVCHQHQIKLYLVQQNRFNRPIQQLRKALDADRFGRLTLGTVRLRWKRDQAYYDQDNWRGTWALDGGVFANQAAHHIDLLLWMMGDVESVIARTSTQLVDIETEDTGIALLRFRSGALGIIEATTATRPRDLEGSISILGERGTVVVGGFAANQIEQWAFDHPLPEDKNVLTQHNENPKDVYGYGHQEFINQVIQSKSQNLPFPISGIEGQKSVELINALYQSSESGKELILHGTEFKTRLGKPFQIAA